MRLDDWCVNPTTFCSSEPDVTYSKDKIIILLILYNARWLVFKRSAFCSSEPDATHSTVKLKCSSFSVSDVAHNDDLQSLFLYTPSDWTNQYWWKIHHWTIHQQKVYHTILHSQEVHHRPVHHQTNRTPTSFTTSGASLYYHVVFAVEQACITMWYSQWSKLVLPCGILCDHTHTHMHKHTYIQTCTHLQRFTAWVADLQCQCWLSPQGSSLPRRNPFTTGRASLCCCVIFFAPHTHSNTPTRSHTHPNSYPGWQLSLDGHRVTPVVNSAILFIFLVIGCLVVSCPHSWTNSPEYPSPSTAGG